MSFLDRITADRRADAQRRVLEGALDRARGQASLVAPALDFVAAITQPGTSVVAEIKRASPAKGPIAPYADAAIISRAYAAGGAAAISVLTESSNFGGKLDDLDAVRSSVSIPVLRKDFISEPLHVWEARAHGADAVLLIVGALTQTELVSLVDLATTLGMTADVEVHDRDEVSRAVDAGARVVAINARDLTTLETDLSTVEKVRPAVPDGIAVIAESGIATRADVERMEQVGVDAIHIGEALMRADDPGAAIAELLGR